MWGKRSPGLANTKTKQIKPIQRVKKANQPVMEEEVEDSEIFKMEKIIQAPLLTYQHPQTRIVSGLGGINSTPYHFTITSMGNALGTALFQLDVSGIVAGNRALLSITGFRTMLLNYAATDFPAIYALTCAQIDGMYDEQGQMNHTVSTTSISGGVSTTLNGGGVIGYNVNFQKTSDVVSWDISNISNLTFGLLSGIGKDEVTYPTASQFIVELTITKIMI